MQLERPYALTVAVALAPFLALPAVAQAATIANPLCATETALFNPDTGSDIVVPAGFKVSVFKSGLNFPTAIAFRGNSQNFEVYVLESGHGLPSVCNDQSKFGAGDFDPTNPFTPDILVFNKNGTLIRGPLAKPTATGDHPTEQLAFKGGWLYWSQGSTTNSGLVGPGGQADIPCQDITLSQNVFLSSVSPLVATSGYSLFGTTNKGGTIQAFFNANTGKVRKGVCDGAILRAKLNDLNN